MPKIHIVKSWPGHFLAVNQGKKKAEIRILDRGYEEGDYIILREFDPKTSLYSGCWLGCFITHIDKDARFGIQQGYRVLSINVLLQGDRYEVTDFYLSDTDGSLNARRKIVH